ncbi:PIG-L family deacetylase [Streptomyces sp. NA04227]|nr:PIG-L family deacetylase [Streptomyces sp. NA04227]
MSEHRGLALAPRRRTVLGAGVVAAVAAGVPAQASRDPEPRGTLPAPASGAPAAQSARPLLLQVLAHPDDDLYFMNPDADRALSADVPVVCVYVTAGEADGVNKIPGRPHPASDRAAYSAARHQGLRQAYAELLGLPVFTPWKLGVAQLPGGRRAETATLDNGRRSVSLVFLNLAMHTLSGGQGIPALWQDRDTVLRTAVAAGSPVASIQTYDAEALLDALVSLFARYRPTVVHTLDPDPDIQESDERTRIRDSEQPGFSDHGDHTAVGLFTWAALARWARTAPGGAPAFVATAFRGYYNHHWPKNLPEPVLGTKASHLVPYGAGPDWDCGNPSGCGDYNVGGDRPLRNRKGWVRSTHHRYPGPRTALARHVGGDRLVAYGVLGMRAVRWEEGRDGEFGAPQDLGGGPLAPTVGLTSLRDGRHLLFALRFAGLEHGGGVNLREIVVLEQQAPGGRFTAWTGLGTPETDADRSRRVGVPVAVTAGDGRVHLFVRNAGKGVSTRVRDRSGRWSPWQDLGPGPVQDGLTAVVTRQGEVRVYGAGRIGVCQWSPHGVLPAPELPAPAGPVAVSRERVLCRPEASDRLLASTGEEIRFPGYGPVLAAGPYLLGRDLRGEFRLLHEGRPVPGTPGVTALDGPALIATEQGAAAAGMSPLARPWLWRPERSWKPGRTTEEAGAAV